MYNSYTITGAQHFDAAEYPLVVSEIELLSRDFLNMPGDHKADMLISYLKNHSIKNDWIDANPQAAKLTISNRFSTGEIESLFTAGRQYPGFLSEFEEYFKSRFRSN